MTIVAELPVAKPETDTTPLPTEETKVQDVFLPDRAEADHISEPPISLADVVSEAIDAYRANFTRAKRYMADNAPGHGWTEARIKKEYRWQLKQRAWARRDARELQKARALGGEALRKMSRAIAGAAAQMHRKGDKRVPVWDWRAGNELAKRQYAKERAEKQAVEDARIEAQQQARIDAEIAAFKKRARGAFPGNDAQFEAAWPRILEDHQVETMRVGMGAHSGRCARSRHWILGQSGTARRCVRRCAECARVRSGASRVESAHMPGRFEWVVG
jgi:hypothetical protein